jgi:hypothetical protein
VDTHPLAQVARPPESDSEDDEETNANNLVEDPKSPAVLMKSPHLQNLDSPDLSDASYSSDEDEQGGVSTRTATSSGTDFTSDVARLSIGGQNQDSDAGTDSMSYVDSLIKASQNAPRKSQPESAPQSPKSGPEMQKSSEGT